MDDGELCIITMVIVRRVRKPRNGTGYGRMLHCTIAKLYMCLPVTFTGLQLLDTLTAVP